VFQNEALVPCTNCGRTFLPDSLVRHQKMCKGGSGPSKGSIRETKHLGADEKSGGGGAGSPNRGAVTKPKETKASPTRNPGERPRQLMCYICGREFGTASLPIHLKSCKTKWEND